MSRGIKYFIRHSMPLDLAEFLRANKCTKRYINNMYKRLFAYYVQTKTIKNRCFYAILRRAIMSVHSRNSLTAILSDSFIWSETPEGHRFWSELSEKAITFQEQYR